MGQIIAPAQAKDAALKLAARPVERQGMDTNLPPKPVRKAASAPQYGESDGTDLMPGWQDLRPATAKPEQTESAPVRNGEY